MTDIPWGRQQRMYARFWPTVRASEPLEKLDLERLASDQAFQRRDLRFVLQQKVRGLELVIEGAGFVLRHPDPDEIARHIVAAGQPMKGFAAEELLHDLALELNAVAAVSGHRFSSELPHRLSILPAESVHFKGRTPPNRAKALSSPSISTAIVCRQ